VRGGLEEITSTIISLVNGKEKWADVAARLPKFEGQEVEA
jgi:glycyl-tRNA synthetase